MPFKSSVSQGYLLALTSKISDLAYEFAAERVLVMGRLVCASFVRSERYSMGGFGAFQLGCFAPDVFDAVVSVAGYGLGTSEPNSGYGAPQPVSGAMVFQAFQPVSMRFFN